MAALHRALLSAAQLRARSKSTILSGTPLRSQLATRSHVGCNWRGRHELVISQSKNEEREPSEEGRLPKSMDRARLDEERAHKKQDAAQKRFDEEYVTFAGALSQAGMVVSAFALFAAAALLADMLAERLGPEAAQPVAQRIKTFAKWAGVVFAIAGQWSLMQVFREHAKLETLFHQLAATHPEQAPQEVEADAQRRNGTNLSFTKPRCKWRLL